MGTFFLNKYLKIKIPRYKFIQNLKWDLIAGITVAVTAIPQGMVFGIFHVANNEAYATIVGLPPIYGLYCAFVPPIIYFIFGTSRGSALKYFSHPKNSLLDQPQLCLFSPLRYLRTAIILQLIAVVTIVTT